MVGDGGVPVVLSPQNSCRMALPLPIDAETAAGAPRRSWLALSLIVTAFWLLRGPILYRQMPAQDEDYFAVPGYTILRDGIPRIPYVPSRDRGSVFYGADRQLMALPPLSFYWQAGVYAVCGPSTASARLASALAGTASIVLVYLLGRSWLREESAAVWGAGLYAFSRVLYFPSLTSRPDALCGLWGLAALWTASRWWESGRRCWLTASGACLGLGLLTHPFAVVYALQIGVWSLCRRSSLGGRLLQGTILAAAALGLFSLWLPLIARDPDLFWTQFGNNVLHRSGPGLLSRAVAPLTSFQAQAPLFLEHVGPFQIVLLLGGAAAALSGAVSFREGWRPTVLTLTVGGLYLHVVCQGEHPTKNYWVYTLAPLYLWAGAALVRWGQSGCRPLRLGRWGPAGALASAAALLAPGAGLRTVAAHVQHWHDVSYSAPRFTQELLRLVPSDGRQAVDPAYIFDFYRAGRDVVLASNLPLYFDVSAERYDLLVAGPLSLRDGVPAALDALFEQAVGDKHDPFACYAEIYVAPPERRPAAEASP